MTAMKANPTQRAFAVMQSKSKVRLRDPSTGAFLHLSGTGTTQTIEQSWLGHAHQADTLKRRATAQGKAWPFLKVARDDPNFYEPDMTE